MTQIQTPEQAKSKKSLNKSLNKKSQEASKANVFDKRSKKYNALEWVFNEAFAEQIRRFIKPQPDDTCLDMGSGTGAVSHLLSRHVLRVTSLDASFKMLKESRGLLGQSKNVDAVMADGSATPFPDQTFDLVVCRNSLHHFRDVEKGIKEIGRLLKAGGRFVLIEPVAPDQTSKPLWSALFKARDIGRHPDFYFTNDELVEHVTRRSLFAMKKNESFALSMGLNQWMDTDCLSEAAKKTIFGIIEETSPSSSSIFSGSARSHLGLGKEGGEWRMDHHWSLVCFQK